jgi:5-methylcytosine-specific restriction endonuclease McrA
MSWNPLKNPRTRAAWRECLMLKQRSLCAICGYRLPVTGELSAELEFAYSATFDHIIPRSQGGHDGLENLRLAHRRCNVARGNGVASIEVTGVPRVLRTSK